MIILVVVSINLIINENILEKTKYGVEKYNEQEEYERVQRAIGDAKIEALGMDVTQDILNKSLQTEFGANNYILEPNDEQFKLTINKSGRNYNIDKSGVIVSVEQGTVADNNNYRNGLDRNNTLYNADNSTVLWLASPACGIYDWG